MNITLVRGKVRPVRKTGLFGTATAKSRARIIFAATLAGMALIGPTAANAADLVNEEFSLPALITYALDHNLEVSASGFDVNAAEARTRAAEGALWPQISVEGGYTMYRDDARLTAARYNGQPGVFGDEVLDTSLVLRLPLYTGGRLTAEVRAAELLEDSAGKRLARSKGDLVYNVSILYFGLLAQEALIESLSFTEEALVSHLKQINELIVARKAAKVDALRIEVKLADIQQRLLRERNSAAIQRKALLNLMGARAAGTGFAVVGRLIPPSAETTGIEALSEIALARRPDVAGAQAEFEAQQARVVSAEAGNWPTVNLTAAVGQRTMFGVAQQPNGYDRSDNDARIGVSFSIPIFEGGRTTARASEEKAKAAAQRTRLDKLRMQVRLEIETAHSNLASGLKRLAGTEAAIALAQESLRIERDKHALGRGTVLDVLDAQSALLEAQATHIRALADANAAAAQLKWAMGENLS